MNKNGLNISILLIILLLITSGCATNSMYRDTYEVCTITVDEPCVRNNIQTHYQGTNAEFQLNFIEIDDQGQIRSRKQFNKVLDELYQKAGKNNVLINVFVHGWHHNAAPDDTNIASFKNSLKVLSATESELSMQQNRKPRDVVGVYIGWRGESVTIPWVNELTFWDRKSTAQEVGYLGVSEILLRLEEISNVKNAMELSEKSRLVIIGHSFGGAVVYSATAQILASRFVDSRADKTFVGPAEGLGDLVVLLNPAFEAIRFAPLFDLAQARCSYMPDQKPKLAILTSVSDDATATLFPIGRFFSTIFETHSDIKRFECGLPISFGEGSADRNTVGHFDPLITHELRAVNAKNLELKRPAVQGAMRDIWRKSEPGDNLQIGPTILTHLEKTHPRNPYLNIKVDKALIEDHNDVFGKEVQEFLRNLILLTTSE